MLFGGLFLQWLWVTRAIDRLVPFASENVRAVIVLRHESEAEW